MAGEKPAPTSSPRSAPSTQGSGHQLPESKGLAKVAALPLAVAMAIFYVALLQVVLGERVASTDDDKQEASCLVVGAVCVSFGLFVLTVVGAVVMALR